MAQILPAHGRVDTAAGEDTDSLTRSAAAGTLCA
jgi:hypothetical protein